MNNQSHKICYWCKKPLLSNEILHGLHLMCFLKAFNVSEGIDFQNLALKHVENSSVLSFFESSFFQGKFKKYSAILDERDYILKVEEQDYPELPKTEYLCNQIALNIGIQVPEYFLLNFYNKMDAFVVKNFMEKFPGGNLIHIYHFFTNNADYNCQNLLHIIQEKTGKRNDLARFVEMCLFDALIGNHDRHGRNLGLIETSRGFTLAPLYDNPSYLALESDWLLEADHNPKGKIATSNSDEPTMRDYKLEFNLLGFDDVVDNFKRKIKIEDIMLLIDNSFISSKRQNAFRNLILKRFKELNHG